MYKKIFVKEEKFHSNFHFFSHPLRSSEMLSNPNTVFSMKLSEFHRCVGIHIQNTPSVSMCGIFSSPPPLPPTSMNSCTIFRENCPVSEKIISPYA